MVKKLISVVVVFCLVGLSTVDARPHVGFGMSFGSRSGVGFGFAVNPQPATYVVERPIIVETRPVVETVFCDTSCGSTCNESFCPSCPDCVNEVNQRYRKVQKGQSKQSRAKKLRAQKSALKTEAVNLKQQLEKLESRLETIEDELTDLSA